MAEAEAFTLLAGGVVIAVGDFSAISVWEPTPSLVVVDPEWARRRLERGPARAIEAVGFVDVAGVIGDATPTVGHEGEGLAYVADRIYTTLGAEAIVGYRVVEEAYEDGGHRPVTAELMLN